MKIETNEIAQIISRHYFEYDEILGINRLQGSTNTAYIIHLRSKQYPIIVMHSVHKRIFLKNMDHIILQSTIRWFLENNNITTDCMIPNKSGMYFTLYNENDIIYLTNYIEGETTHWNNQVFFKKNLHAFDLFGGLQAMWDNCFYKYSFQDISAHILKHQDLYLLNEAIEGSQLNHVIDQIQISYYYQSKYTNYIDMYRITENPKLFSLHVIENYEKAERRYPKTFRIFNMWKNYIFDTVVDTCSNLASLKVSGQIALRYCDMSPTNSFFVPNLNGFTNIRGFIDFDLCRWCEYKFDLGVMASLRINDHMVRNDYYLINSGKEVQRVLQLNTGFEHFLCGYLQNLDQHVWINYDDLLSIYYLLKFNIIGLVYYLPHTMTIGLYDDNFYESYIIEQIVRLCMRNNLTIMQFSEHINNMLNNLPRSII